MKNTKTTQITSDDMNAIDFMNGSGSVSSKDTIVVNADGESLKGALAKYNSTFSQYDEIQFIEMVRRQLFEFQIERFKYNNLPEGLDKFRLERKTIEHGSSLIIKVAEQFFSVRYSIIDFNMYDEPAIVKINEPKNKLLNGKQYDLRGSKPEAVIFRNNQFMKPALTEAYRLIRLLEKIMYQIERNLVVSAPKGILNLKNNKLAFEEDGDAPLRDSLENIATGQNTFFVLKSVDTSSRNAFANNDEQIWIPMEFDDRTANLIMNYSFVKEQLKEIVGGQMNILNGKKERLITDEVNKQQAFPNATMKHAFNIRQRDIEKLNSAYGTNISIEMEEDDSDVEEPEQEEEE